MSDMHDDKLEKAVLAAFQAEQEPLPVEPFMTTMQARLRAQLMAELTLAQQRVQRRQLFSTVAKAVAVVVLARLLQPLMSAGAEAVSSLQAAVQEATLVLDLSNPLLLVAVLYVAALAWCFRSRLRRLLAPW